MSDRARYSLLFPTQAPPTTDHIGSPDTHDLGFTPIIEALNFDGRHARFIEATLGTLLGDAATITYRQAALRELIDQPLFAAQLAEALPQLQTLAEAGPTARWRDNVPLLLVGARLADLNAYVACIEHLWQAIDQATPPLQAAAWQNLRSLLAALRADEDYQRLAEDLPRLRFQFERAGSVTIGINLDGQLQPESATVLSINAERVSSKGGVIERLLGERYTADALRGITALYKASEGQRNMPEHDLFRDLTRLLERIAAPVSAALERYTRLNSTPLVGLIPELVFYLGALRLKQRLEERGLPVIFPNYSGHTADGIHIRGSYSVELALRNLPGTPIVHNDVAFAEGEQIALISGLNSGGKTTYARAIAQAQAMFQAGLFVAGSSAMLTPIDGMFSHFATVERASGSGGRLAEELEHCAAIMQRATPHSLIIFNEPFTSTDAHSAFDISRDLLAGLRLLGARTIYITHLQELITSVTATHAASGIVSLVATAAADASDQHEAPTFRVVRGQPQPSAFARELARRYGLDRSQLEQQISNRLKQA